MSNKEKEHRCKSCGKLLLDEKLPFCIRCRLEGRNKVPQIGGVIAAGFAAIALGVRRFADNNSDGSNGTIENDDTVD